MFDNDDLFDLTDDPKKKDKRRRGLFGGLFG